MSKEQKLSVAGLLAVLVAGVFMPLAIAQEPPGAWTGTWVGSYKARWVCSFTDPDGTDTYGEEFTVYLTLTFKGWEHTGRQRIVYNKFYWTSTNPDIRATGASISPREFDVAIHGFIAVDNHLYLIPDQTVTKHEALSGSYRTNLPDEPEKWEPYTNEHEDELLTPFIDVGVGRVGDVMRVCESHSSSENLETVTITSTYYAAGALVLQKEGRIEIKPTCLAAEGAMIQHAGEGLKEYLKPGVELAAGDRITTETTGAKATILLPNGLQITLDGPSWVTVEELLESGDMMFSVGLGRLFFRVISFIGYDVHKKSHIRTPVCIAGVRDTEFTIEVSEDGTTTLTVLEGTVTFSDLQETKTIEVSQNQTSTIRPGGVPSEPLAIDPSKLEAWWEQKPVEETETTEITSTSITQTLPPTTVTVVSTTSSETITTSSAPTTPLPTTSIITTTKETETSAATKTTATKPPVTMTPGPGFALSTTTIVIIIVVIVAAGLAVAALRLSKKKQVKRGKTDD